MSNTVTVVGNLVADPELKYTSSGVAMSNLRLAVSRRYQKGGEWTEDTSYFSGTVWRELAESVAKSLHKGDRVIVTGRLEQRSWETDGQKRSVVEIQVDEIGPSLKWVTATVTRIPKRDTSAPF